MTQGFYVNSADCYGCKSCQVACATEKVLTPGVFIRRVRQINAAAPGGHAFVSMACNHCDEPACVANCPVGAYQKMDNGLVVQDHDKCIGCKTCIEACPFHAPSYDEATSRPTSATGAPIVRLAERCRSALCPARARISPWMRWTSCPRARMSRTSRRPNRT